jgi:hypothetical protein
MVRKIAGHEQRIRMWPHRADRFHRRREPRNRITVRDAGRRADGDGSDLHCDFVGFEAQ